MFYNVTVRLIKKFKNKGEIKMTNKNYTYSVYFYAVYPDGTVYDDGNVYQNKALGDFLLNTNVIEVNKAYELNKAIFEEDNEIESFEDFEHDYNSEHGDKMVMVTEEMVDTFNKNFEKFGLDDYISYPDGAEFVAFVSYHRTITFKVCVHNDFVVKTF